MKIDFKLNLTRMTKKITFLILVLFFLITACRNEETFTNYETQKQELISKSLWKEDMVYIKNVKNVFEVNFNEEKFYQNFGEVEWSYAMSFGSFDETFLRVPIIKDEKVVSIMQAVRNKERDKVYFSHTEDKESLNFFQSIIFSKRNLKPLKDSAYPNSNPTGRAYWNAVKTCTSRTLEVGCVYETGSVVDCTPLYSTTTTCTTTYVYVDDYSDDPNDGINPPDGYNYDGTRPNITDDNTKNPCENAKEQIINNEAVKNEINNLKEEVKQNGGIGENGFKLKKDGTTTPVTSNGEHHVDFGDKSGSKGGYHNHTDSGMHMFSPQDIGQMLGFARAQGSVEGYDSGFLGMIAKRGDTFVNYSIRFKGDYSQLISFNYMKEELEDYKDKMRTEYYKILFQSGNSTTINGKLDLNESGLEKLFFSVAKMMGIDQNIILQKIDNNNGITNYQTDANGIIFRFRV